MDALYYHLFFAITIIACIVFTTPPPSSRLVTVPSKTGTIFIAILAVVLIGLLPIPWNTGADREVYALQFLESQKFGYNDSKDVFFWAYQYFSGLFLDYRGWFVLTAAIYVGNYYRFSIKTVPLYSFVLLLMCLTSFSFYAYGTNTIRAGFAASFLILALCSRSWLLMSLWLLVAVSCHFSMLIPVIAIVITRFFDRTKLFCLLWVSSIFLSLVLGSFFEEFFAHQFAIDERVSYLVVSARDTQYKVGFRLDFILYSCAPIILGYYYIYRRNFKDRLYKQLFNTYLLTNIFWILVIRANFSDRFAYLSWFLYPILLIYPMLKERLVKYQNQKIALVVLFHECFTYLMFLR